MVDVDVVFASLSPDRKLALNAPIDDTVINLAEQNLLLCKFKVNLTIASDHLGAKL